MDYEKLYKDALERARQVHTTNVDENKKSTEYIFPELKESKDEKIKTWLEEHIEAMPDNSVEFKDVKRIDVLHWLEKQGDESLVNFDEAEKEKYNFVSGQYIECRASFNEFKKDNSYWLEYVGNDTYIGRSDNILNQKFHITPRQLYSLFTQQHCQKEDNTNKVEPKFKGGDMLVDNCKRTWKVVGIKNGCYILEDGNKGIMHSLIELVDKTFHLWTKQDVNLANDEKPTDEIIPKFKIGDWVVRKDGYDFFDGRKVALITKIDGEQHWFDCGTWLDAKDIRLWTIGDAKDGDILCVNDEVFIYAHRRQGYNIVGAHCYVDSADGFYLEGDFLYTEKGNSIHPATIEQMQKLFSAMHDAGYIWNVENKVIIKNEE